MIPFRYPLHLRRLLAALLLLAGAPCAAYAQLEHALWYFGDEAGLDFRAPGAPRALTNSVDESWEGTATMCDPTTGAMLFHTDGDTVWNRNWQVMPNGTLLGGHNSSTQAALILPMPGDSSKYYIVSTDAADYFDAGPGGDGAMWAIVDMNLNGGLGGVTQRNVVLHTPVSEKVVAVPHCNGRGFWVVLHELRSARYIVYYLSKNGFEGPAFYDIGTPHSGTTQSGIGGMKFNASGTRIATAIFVDNRQSMSGGRIDLLDFDRRTGTLSNPVSIVMDEYVYDVCFSPDETKLYASGEKHRYVAQLDLRGSTAAQIKASYVELWRSAHPNAIYEHAGQIQVGRDGRLYVAIRDQPYISVINRPNLAGRAADYQQGGVYTAGLYGSLGLPNYVYGLNDARLATCKPPRSRVRATSVVICAGETVTFADESVDDPTRWEWSFAGGEPSLSLQQHPGVVRYANAGVHQAMLVTENANGSDTAYVDITVNPRPVIEAGDDRTICIGSEARIDMSAQGAATFAWSPASGLSCTTCEDPVASPSSTTRYTVVATSPEGCTSTDEVTVIVEPYPVVDAGSDVEICIGESAQLDGRGGTEFLWSPSTGLSCTTCANPLATPTVSTTYTLMSTNNGRCAAYDSVRITVHALPTAEAGDDARVCAGDPVQLRASGGVRYQWSPAEGLSCTDCAAPVATAYATTRYTVRAFSAFGCSTADSMTIDVDAAPGVVNASLGPDIAVYPGAEVELPIVLENALDTAAVSIIDLQLQYDPTIMFLQRATLDSSLTEDWTVVVTGEDRARGLFAARLFALGTTLRGTGILARLRFQTFINAGDSSTARLSVTLPGKGCTRVLTRPTVVRLDSICGLSQRLLESTGETYALLQNSPNPFNPSTTIDFALGLDGPTLVEVIDALGSRVAVLVDAHLRAGAYSVAWDASEHATGVYYCRVTSGAWTRTIRMSVSR